MEFCILNVLMIDLYPNDEHLMDFLGVKFEEANLFEDNQKITKKRVFKDKGQREICGCIMSKDIGQYNTCPHECVYCYANTSKEMARKNYKMHTENKTLDTITGIY
jgi:biotin synthase-like enzyme